MNKEDEQLQKIQKYFQVFNDFILIYHNSSQPQDQSIMKQWLLFKKTIEKSPADLLSQQTYLKNRFGTKLNLSSQVKSSTMQNVKKKSQKQSDSSKITKNILKQMKVSNVQKFGIHQKK